MRNLICAILILFAYQVNSQVAVGHWRAHLPYSTGINVEPSNDKVYCLSTGGLFVYSNNDNSTSTLTKINGLSDVVISALQFIPEKNTLVIGYENGNIDLIKDNTVYNISDIYRKQITGSKSINNINYINGKTYLSCGFGIIVLDVDRNEIKDTYYIGSNGTYIDVMEMCSDNTYLYAATTTGIYKALESSQNLVNFANWSLITNIPNYNKKFDHIVYFDNHILTTYSNNGWNKDTTYIYDNVSWAKFDTTMKEITNMVVSANKLIICSYSHLRTYNSYTDLTGTNYYGFSPTAGSLPRDAEFSNNGTLWIADNNLGMVWQNAGMYNYEFTTPNGPSKKTTFSIVAGKNEVYAVPGGHDISYRNLWNNGEIFSFKNQTWTNFSANQIPELSNAFDMSEIAINHNNPNQVFFGSYGGGVLEFNNGNFVAKYDYTNSTLQPYDPSFLVTIIGGIVIDEDDNLWVTNSGSQIYPNLLSVKKPNGQWKSFSLYSEAISNDISKIVIDKHKTKWMILPRGRGLLAFNENGTIDNISDDQKKYISVSDENGDIISNAVYSIAVDKDGIIWVGTNKGVPFYYNPENVFNSNFYAQQVKIPNENPGQANYLLEAETVTAIAIDGANQKWFGTESGGAFLMSPDGTKELLHFTKENSPLLSNSIISIAIEPVSGEVFFATENGIISYRSTSTEPEEYFHDVTVFPNPVKPGYDGIIAINGLVSDTDIKISDIVGNVVYQTKSEGGQATWNGRKFNGERVQTGVYLVFCSNEDGSKTFITKILFIN